MNIRVPNSHSVPPSSSFCKHRTPTLTMMSLMFFVLCSGSFHLTCTANHLRNISILTDFMNSEGCNENKYDWSGALTECNKTEGSLLTLYDQHDADFVKGLLGGYASTYWLGLHKHLSNVTTWSNGDQLIFNKSNVKIKPGEQICEAIEAGEWKGFNCSDRKPFVCQKNNSYNLINKKRNWCQARQYCRTHSSDLVSISDDQQNEHLKNISLFSAENKTFWIGLLHDEWGWADNSCSTYRRWGEHQPIEPGDCGSLSESSLASSGCINTRSVLCSKGSVRVIAVSHLLPWEEALNYCEANHTRILWIEDEADQNAVEQWLNYTIDFGNYSDTLWLGLRQSSVFGFWIWSDRIVNWKNWRDDTIPELSLSYSHCGVINATDYKWSAENCEEKHSFLCEEDIF